MRWYRATRERHWFEGAPVVLVCACGVRSESIDSALKHRADYHTPGVCSVRMLLNQTFRWKEERERRSRPNRMVISNVCIVNRQALYRPEGYLLTRLTG